MPNSEQLTFPLIYSFEGAASNDGLSFRIEGTSFDGEIVRFSIPLSNIQHFVAFLLLWVRNLSPDGSMDSEGDPTGGSRLPIPATSIAIGHPEGGEAYIGISVGRAELVFSLPVSSLETVGQSLILAGAAPSNTKPV
jgi:hypothetical protein